MAALKLLFPVFEEDHQTCFLGVFSVATKDKLASESRALSYVCPVNFATEQSAIVEKN